VPRDSSAAEFSGYLAETLGTGDLKAQARGELHKDHGSRAPDMFVVPSWAIYEHCNGSNDERAILFSIQDTPLVGCDGWFSKPAVGDRGRA